MESTKKRCSVCGGIIVDLRCQSCGMYHKAETDKQQDNEPDQGQRRHINIRKRKDTEPQEDNTDRKNTTYKLEEVKDQSLGSVLKKKIVQKEFSLNMAGKEKGDGKEKAEASTPDSSDNNTNLKKKLSIFTKKPTLIWILILVTLLALLAGLLGSCVEYVQHRVTGKVRVWNETTEEYEWTDEIKYSTMADCFSRMEKGKKLDPFYVEEDEILHYISNENQPNFVLNMEYNGPFSKKGYFLATVRGGSAVLFIDGDKEKTIPLTKENPYVVIQIRNSDKIYMKDADGNNVIIGLFLL